LVANDASDRDTFRTIRRKEAALYFRLLGPLEVSDGDRVLSLGGAKQRALLAILLLRANEVVSTDRLIDELWGEEPPPTAAKVVQVYVSQLRKAMAGRGRDPVIATRPPGYAVHVQAGQLDVDRFEKLLADARQARAAGNPEVAARLLREGLALWRGQALADFAYEPFAQAAVARLEELRLVALEERIESDLAAGGHAAVVAELEALAAQYPLREGLRGQLMLALYRSGRQAEALEAYQQARRALVDELGIDPGSSLQELERAILRQDPILDPPSAEGAAAGEVPMPAEPSVERAILVVPRGDHALPVLLSLTGPLATAPPRHELLLTRLVEPLADGGAGTIGDETAALRELRDDLAGRGVAARVAAFTSTDPGADILRLAAGQLVDLLVLDVDAGELGEPGRSELLAVLEGAPCDVAVASLRGETPLELGPGRPVLVPFGASSHDWAALELGCWIARGHAAPLHLLGTAPDHEHGRRDASRLLADASLIVQRIAGLVPEPVLVQAGAEGIVEAAQGGGVVIAAVSERWREEGLGSTRLAVAERAPAPVLFVRRGVRPGALAPPDQLTRFAWSVAGAAGGAQP
jgi:DNA-binding SARP family transcriptional activator